MKKILLLIFLTIFFSSVLRAKTFDLKYVPKGQIIVFNLRGLTICTDTSSIFDLFKYDKIMTGGKSHKARVINFIRKKVNEANSDTLIFEGEKIPFKDLIEESPNWNIPLFIVDLIKFERVIIYKQKERIIIKRKREGSRPKGKIDWIYLNKNTKEEYFRENIYFAIREKGMRNIL